STPRSAEWNEGSVDARAIRGRTMPNAAPTLHLLPRSGAPFPIIFREPLARVQGYPRCARRWRGLDTRGALPLQWATTGAPDSDAVLSLGSCSPARDG